MSYYHESRCKVCTSKFRDEYERKKLDDTPPLTLDELSQYAKETHNEDISYASFQRHFMKHIARPIAQQMQYEETYVKKRDQGIEIITQMSSNLTTANSLVSNMLNKGDILDDPKKVTALKGLLTEIRLTLEALLKIRSQIVVEPIKDKKEALELLLEVLNELPQELVGQIIHKIKVKLDEHNRGSTIFD